MIIKGACRTNGSQLGSYLGNYLVAEKNDRVQMVQLRGSAHRGLTDALASWEAEAVRTRCKKPLWHAQLRTPSDEHLTREQQIAAVDILEKHLGFDGQPRAIVIHENDGHQHVHVVWSRIDRETGKARRDDFTHKKNVAAAREIEERFGLQAVESPEFDKKGTRQERREQSRTAPTYKEFQKAKRSGFDPRERKATITRLWHESDSGKALSAALQDAGYILARGDSRNYVVVDKAGDIHSLARQIKDANTEQVKQRLADIDPASIPKAKHIQLQMFHAFGERQAAQAERKAESEDQNSAQRVAEDAATDGAVKTKASNPKAGELAGENPLDPAVILAALTKGQSTFTKSDLHLEIKKRIVAQSGQDDPRATVKLARAVGQHHDFVTLGNDRVGRPRYTSREMLETELSMRDSSDVLAARKVHGVFHKIRDAAPSAQTLGTEQRTAFEHVTSAEALSIVIGYAGTGKSTMLKSAREAWEGAGYRVRGLALSGMAAQSLQEGSAIESRTLASMFKMMEKLPEQQAKISAMDQKLNRVVGNEFEQRKRRSEMRANRDMFAARVDAISFTKRDIIVLDEAAMVGSRDMDKLLTAARSAGAKVVLVGDAEQLQAIDAGGAFRAMTERHGAVKISEIRRQREEWAKAATKDFGDGFTTEALSTYKGKGFIHELAGHSEARARVVEDWTASRKANPNDTHLMLAFTREDVARLNEQARKVYEQEGRLGVGEMVKTEDGKKEFARGDRMYFLQNDTRLGVKNGTLGTIEKIERNSVQDYHRITVRLDGGAEPRTVQFSTADYGKFSHGFANTIHKSQGATANRTHILASQWMDRHAAYVGMSRHTDEVNMYYSKAEFKDFDGMAAKLSRDRRKDTTLDYLGRAEQLGIGDLFLRAIRKVQKVVEIMSKEERVKRAAERMAVAIKLSKDPAARKAERERQHEIAEGKRKLAQILGEHPDKKRDRSFGMGL